MIYQKPISFEPKALGNFERKQAPCASNRAPFSLSYCCSVGAGEYAGHPGTGPWLCLKMFFLEARSYVLPRRNENKAPKGSLGSLEATLRHCSVLGSCPEEVRKGLCPELWGGYWQVRSQQGTVGVRADHMSSLTQGIHSAQWPLLLSDNLPAQHCSCPSLFLWIPTEAKGHMQRSQKNLESQSWLSADESISLNQPLSPFGQQISTAQGCSFYFSTLPYSLTTGPSPPWPGSHKATYSKWLTRLVELCKQPGSMKRKPSEEGESDEFL